MTWEEKWLFFIWKRSQRMMETVRRKAWFLLIPSRFICRSWLRENTWSRLPSWTSTVWEARRPSGLVQTLSRASLPMSYGGKPFRGYHSGEKYHHQPRNQSNSETWLPLWITCPGENSELPWKLPQPIAKETPTMTYRPLPGSHLTGPVPSQHNRARVQAPNLLSNTAPMPAAWHCWPLPSFH